MARALGDIFASLRAPRQRAGRSGKWSDFGVRLASAAILAPVALAALWFGDGAWQALVAVVMLGLAGEWTRLSGLGRGNIAIFVAVFTCWLLAGSFGWAAGAAGLVLFGLLTWWRFGWFAAAGIPYIGIGGFSVLWLRLQPQIGLRAALFLVAVIWATDIGAYLAGRLVGGAKLAPRISPGKTWSGSAGGLLIGGVAGALVAGGGQFVPAAFGAAVVLSVFAQVGDLLESAIKRKLGVKDSGRTIPGHGGLFDRLDGFLAAAPVAVLLVIWMHHGLASGFGMHGTG